MEIHLVRHNTQGVVGHAITCPQCSGRWRVKWLHKYEEEPFVFVKFHGYVQDLGVIGNTEENDFFS
jgi:hypothetical protein